MADNHRKEGIMNDC